MSFFTHLPHPSFFFFYKMTRCLRLPRQAVPMKYNVYLFPYFYGDDSNQFKFAGSVAIFLTPVVNTRALTLHAKHLWINSSWVHMAEVRYFWNRALYLSFSLGLSIYLYVSLSLIFFSLSQNRFRISSLLIQVIINVCICVHTNVCVRTRARVCVRACVRACVCVCVCACVCACVCVCKCRGSQSAIFLLHKTNMCAIPKFCFFIVCSCSIFC